jgi:hypothetical protein
MGLREGINQRPWLGWSFAGIAAVAALFLMLQRMGNNAPDSIERRSQQVTIRCTETGEEWTMNRGQFERLLLLQSGEIDPSQGIPSEFADGRLTGVLVDTDDWEETVERINAMKRSVGGG